MSALHAGNIYRTTVALGGFSNRPPHVRAGKFDITVAAGTRVAIEGPWPEPLNEHWYIAKACDRDVWIPVGEDHVRPANQ